MCNIYIYISISYVLLRIFTIINDYQYIIYLKKSVNNILQSDFIFVI